jgi:diphosphomevalonate decarboxylase
MNKVTVKSPSNIAFIKFWGKKDPAFNIPFNNSVSMNLNNCFTITSVQFDKKLKDDDLEIDGKVVEGDKKDRVSKFLNIVRKMSDQNIYARVESKNNFPSDAGIASSASAFSALSLAASKAAGLSLSEKELSILARRGSGSASRSVNSGFSEWKAGKSDQTSYSVSIATPSFWDIRDLVVVVSTGVKKASSTEGHSAATTSPFFTTRQKIIGKRIKNLKAALLAKNFRKFGELIEEEAIELHIMAMTSKPAIYYWNEGTMLVMSVVRDLRESGILCYYTMDAGPNVHVICLGKDEFKIKNKLSSLKNVIKVISNKAAPGTRIVK